MECRHYDDYNISRTDCSLFASSGEYLNHKMHFTNQLFRNAGKYVYHSHRDRMKDKYQVLNTNQTKVGDDGRTYYKRVLLNNSSSNECRQLVQPPGTEFSGFEKSGYWVQRGYLVTQLPR